MLPADTHELPSSTPTTTIFGVVIDKGSRESNVMDPPNNVIKMISESPVIIIGRRGCCMCHVVQRLLQGLGANPPVYEVNEDHEADVIRALSMMIDCGGIVQFPAVFVGGQFFGGLERVMATHISDELVPILKSVRALWL